MCVCIYIYIYIYIYIMYLGTWHYLTLLAHIVKYAYRHVCIVVRFTHTHCVCVYIYIYIYIYPCRSLGVSMKRWLTLSVMSALVHTVRYMLVLDIDWKDPLTCHISYTGSITRWTHCFPKVNTMLLPRWKYHLSCIGDMLDRTAF